MFVKHIQAKPPVCEQPECALRQGHINRPRLADLLIRALSKKDSIDRIPEQARITPRNVCIECAQRVIRGHKPLLTMAEREQIFTSGTKDADPHTH
jgi:hypothetical protein